MSTMAKEGWYRDPSRRHDWRWFSNGSATSLVRDGEATSRDPVLPEEVAAYADLELEQPPDTAPLIYNPNDIKPKSVVIRGGGATTVAYDPPDKLYWRLTTSLSSRELPLLDAIALPRSHQRESFGQASWSVPWPSSVPA